MAEPSQHTELFLRFSRRGLMIVLVLVVAIGLTMAGTAIWPDSVLVSWPVRMPWLLPILSVVAAIALRAPMRGQVFDPGSTEIRAVLDDERRLKNLAHGQRVALIVVLAIQIPLAVALSSLPALRALMAMASLTMTLGIGTLIGMFLMLERQRPA